MPKHGRARRQANALEQIEAKLDHLTALSNLGAPTARETIDLNWKIYRLYMQADRLRSSLGMRSRNFCNIQQLVVDDELADWWLDRYDCQVRSVTQAQEAILQSAYVHLIYLDFRLGTGVTTEPLARWLVDRCTGNGLAIPGGIMITTRDPEGRRLLTEILEDHFDTTISAKPWEHSYA